MGSDFLIQRDLPNPGKEPESPALETDSLPFEPPGKQCTNMASNHTAGKLFHLKNMFSIMTFQIESLG